MFGITKKDGREINVKVEGQLVLNNVNLLVDAAIAGHGIAHRIEDRVAPLVAEGKLVRILEDWCASFDGYFLYYPSRRQISQAFELLLDALR